MHKIQGTRSKIQEALRCALSFGLCALCLGCERESRPFNDIPGATANAAKPALAPLFAGGVSTSPGQMSPFQENAWGIGEGKQLFDQYNCSGCHAHGGGGMGPALMDNSWIYGPHPANIFETIVEGRPNGMPSWRGKLTDAQVWQLVAYIQSMSGNAPLAALPGRSDHLSAGTPENLRPAQTPVQTGHP
jgi:cytochrome c oxidase cbb3-type subunit III